MGGGVGLGTCSCKGNWLGAERWFAVSVAREVGRTWDVFLRGNWPGAEGSLLFLPQGRLVRSFQIQSTVIGYCPVVSGRFLAPLARFGMSTSIPMALTYQRTKNQYFEVQVQDHEVKSQMFSSFQFFSYRGYSGTDRWNKPASILADLPPPENVATTQVQQLFLVRLLPVHNHKKRPSSYFPLCRPAVTVSRTTGALIFTLAVLLLPPLLLQPPSPPSAFLVPASALTATAALRLLC